MRRQLTAPLPDFDNEETSTHETRVHLDPPDRLPGRGGARARRGTDPATGEKYNVEVSYGLWNPTPEFEISSESLGIPGTVIDLVEDFGFEKKRLGDFRVTLRPAKKHKFRLGYVPIKYDVEGHILRR